MHHVTQQQNRRVLSSHSVGHVLRASDNTMIRLIVVRQWCRNRPSYHHVKRPTI